MPTGVAEGNTKQDFVDILDKEVIGPLVTFNVSEEDLMWAGISVLIIGRSGRQKNTIQESRLRKI